MRHATSSARAWSRAAFLAAVLTVPVWVSLGAKPLAKQPAWLPLAVPRSVGVREVVDHAPTGWTADVQKGEHVLAGLTFFDGPPGEMASLVYEAETRKGKTLVLTWSFDPQAPKGTWIRCHYSGTSVVLDSPLPKGTSGARVVLDATSHVDGYEQVMSVEIR